jgi:hypothetical protein
MEHATMPHLAASLIVIILSVYNGEAGCQDLLCLIENHDESSNGYGYGGVMGRRTV